MISIIPALLRRRVRPSKREKAAIEARRGWEAIRAGVAERADHLADVAADQLTEARDAAAPKVGQIRDATVPQVREMRRRAQEAVDPVAERLRTELADFTSTAGREIARMAVEVRAATSDEADRIIQEFHDQAERLRAEERRARVRALIGWTAFGLIAGAVLAREYEQRTSTTEAGTPVPPVEPIPTVLPEEELTADGDGLPSTAVSTNR